MLFLYAARPGRAAEEEQERYSQMEKQDEASLYPAAPRSEERRREAAPSCSPAGVFSGAL